ncbi:DUF4386 domain-containing protein [Pseudoroseicyclus sp. CXY001]|uniref:DUF4386 domain-containing protein n=1 Tax=Pseudoroseicyclus sp. CXY001 TaxID=3242492 RepID=UPI00357146B1
MIAPLFTLAEDPTSRPYARLTGALYLSIAVFGAFAIGYVPSVVVQPDAAETLAAIRERSLLFHLGIGADALVMLIEIVTTAMLFFMFRPVSPVLSAAAALARLSMVAVMATMLFFQAGLKALAASGGAPELAELLLGMHHAGVLIWQLFFWLHLALLGQLVARSERFPRLLGHALTLGSFGYLLHSLHAFAFPEAELLQITRTALLALVSCAEVGFALWMAILGQRPAPAPAARPAGLAA